jgi:hypothetical protein
VFGGRITLVLLSDPLVTGANPLGTTHLQLNDALIEPTPRRDQSGPPPSASDTSWASSTSTNEP